jgi:predicted nucleic acid-binding protein
VTLIKTYIDSGVLISAYQGTNEIASKAIEYLDDANRQFISSPFVKLEVLAKATYHKQQREVEFYEAFFLSCLLWADDLVDIVQLALRRSR